jgi:hypothetical protein
MQPKITFTATQLEQLLAAYRVYVACMTDESVEQAKQTINGLLGGNVYFQGGAIQLEEKIK